MQQTKEKEVFLVLVTREECNKLTTMKLVPPIIKSSKGGVLGARKRRMQQIDSNETGSAKTNPSRLDDLVDLVFDD